MLPDGKLDAGIEPGGKLLGSRQGEGHLALANQRFKRGQIGALVGADQIGQSLGGDAEWIADGQPDPPLAQIKCEDSGDRAGQVNFIINAA